VMHELDSLPEGAERLDDYLRRRLPDAIIYWYEEGNAGNIQVRDYFDTEAGMFNRKRWYLQWWNGVEWIRLCDLEPGRRPRMFQTYCYIVEEKTDG